MSARTKRISVENVKKEGFVMKNQKWLQMVVFFAGLLLVPTLALAIDDIPSYKTMFFNTFYPKAGMTKVDVDPGIVRDNAATYYEGWWRENSYYRPDPATGLPERGFNMVTKTYGDKAMPQVPGIVGELYSNVVETVGQATPSQLTYSGNLSASAFPGGGITFTLSSSSASSLVVSDAGNNGTLGGDGAGVIDYNTGAFNFTLVSAPSAGPIVASYQSSIGTGAMNSPRAWVNLAQGGSLKTSPSFGAGELNWEVDNLHAGHQRYCDIEYGTGPDGGNPLIDNYWTPGERFTDQQRYTNAPNAEFDVYIPDEDFWNANNFVNATNNVHSPIAKELAQSSTKAINQLWDAHRGEYYADYLNDSMVNSTTSQVMQVGFESSVGIWIADTVHGTNVYYVVSEQTVDLPDPTKPWQTHYPLEGDFYHKVKHDPNLATAPVDVPLNSVFDYNVSDAQNYPLVYPAWGNGLDGGPTGRVYVSYVTYLYADAAAQYITYNHGKAEYWTQPPIFNGDGSGQTPPSPPYYMNFNGNTSVVGDPTIIQCTVYVPVYQAGELWGEYFAPDASQNPPGNLYIDYDYFDDPQYKIMPADDKWTKGLDHEPFEDFISWWGPTLGDPGISGSPQGAWVVGIPDMPAPVGHKGPTPSHNGVVDPFANISFQEYKDYINNNYPGNCAALIARAGNGLYDGPDDWKSVKTLDNSKYQQHGFIVTANTPITAYPGTYGASGWDFYGQYGSWDNWWVAHYAATTAGNSPGWTILIPAMSYWAGNATNAYVSVMTTTTNMVSGSVVIATNWSDVSYPPKGSTWGYKSPQEYDDLASSMYHSGAIDPLHIGGDVRLGENTSPWVWDIKGEDVGTDYPPIANTQPDFVYPASGPLAYDVYGTDGFDAGNQLNLEWMTWRTDGTCLTGPKGGGSGSGFTQPQYTKDHRDVNLDGLIDLGETVPDRSSNYSVDCNPIHPVGGRKTDYPWNWGRYFEDCVAAWDSSEDFYALQHNNTTGTTEVRLQAPDKNFQWANGILANVAPYTYLDHVLYHQNPAIPHTGIDPTLDDVWLDVNKNGLYDQEVIINQATTNSLTGASGTDFPAGSVRYFDMDGDGQFTVGTDFAWYDANGNGQYDTDLVLQDPTGWMKPGEVGHLINWRPAAATWTVCYSDSDGTPGPSAGDNFWLSTNGLTAFDISASTILSIGNPGALSNGLPGVVVANARYFSRQPVDNGPVIGMNGDDIWVDNNPTSPNDGVFTAEQAVHAPHGLKINTTGITIGVVAQPVAYVSDVAGPYQRVYDDVWLDANGNGKYDQDTIIINNGGLVNGLVGLVPPAPVAWLSMPDENGLLHPGVFQPIHAVPSNDDDSPYDYYGDVLWLDTIANGVYDIGTSYTVGCYSMGWISQGVNGGVAGGGESDGSGGIGGLSVGPHFAKFGYSALTRDNTTFGGLAHCWFASPKGFAGPTHEQGHELMGWLDYYDYNVWGIHQGFVSHHPIGAFDLMANGGLVHGIGSTKSSAHLVDPQPLNYTASDRYGNVLTPALGAPNSGIHTLLMYPAERFPDQYYYFQNPNPSMGEDFCFYYEDGGSVYSTMGRGVYINHDMGGSANGHPWQQRINDHYTWEMVEADGLYRMEDGLTFGDPACVWGPNTKKVFNEYSQPPARWWDQSVAGVRIVDIRFPADAWGPCEVDFEWTAATSSDPWYWVAPGGAAASASAAAAAAGGGAATGATWGTLTVPLATGATWTSVPQWQYNSGTVANPVVSVEPMGAAPYSWSLTQNQSGSTTMSGSGVSQITYKAGTNSGVDVIMVTAQGTIGLDPSCGTNIDLGAMSPISETISFNVSTNAVAAGMGAGLVAPQLNAPIGVVSAVQGIGLAANGGLLGTVAGGVRGDSDNDGIPDAWEIYWFNRYATNPGDQASVLAVANGTSDWDGDGLPDYAEWLAHLNPIDQWSWSSDTNRTLTDADADIAGSHISNLNKYNAGLNMREPDSDDDGISDADEMNPTILKVDQSGPNGYRKVTDPLYSRSPLIERSLHVSTLSSLAIPSYENNDYHRFELPVWTVEAWVKLDNTNQTGTIMYRQTAQGFTNFVMGVNKNVPYVGFTTEAGNPYIAYSASALKSNEWHHLAGVFNDTNNTLRLYLDGTLTNSLQVLEIPATGHPILLAGQQMTGFVKLGGGFNGFVDEVRIWSAPRSDYQILFGYNKIVNSPWLPGVLWVNQQSFSFALTNSMGNDGSLVSNLRFDDGQNTTITNKLDGLVHSGGIEDWVHPLGANEGTYWNGGDRVRAFGYCVAPITANEFITSNTVDVVHRHLMTNTDMPYDDVNEDGIPDWWQAMYWPTFNPTLSGSWDAGADPDGDGKTNLQEYLADTNPRDPTNIYIAPPTNGGGGTVTSTNSTTDTDGDGLPDWWETKYNLDPNDATGVNGPWGDPDHDGLCNLAEYLAGTSPQNAYTQGSAFTDFDTIDPLTGLTYGWEYGNSDGMPALWKFANNLSPLGYEANGDPDRDGWDNYNEYMAGTNPQSNSSTPKPPLTFTTWYDGSASGNLIIQAYSSAKMDGMPDATITVATGIAPNFPLTFTANSSTNVTIPASPWGIIEYVMPAGGSLDSVPSWWYNVGTVANPVEAVETVAPPPYTWNLIQNQSGSTTLSGTGVPAIMYTAGPNSGVDIIQVTSQGTTTLDTNGFHVVHAAAQPITSSIYISVNGASISTTSGTIKEGDNWFFTFIDENGNGTWDPGEPCGYAVYQPINMTWGAAAVDLQIQDNAQGFPRFQWNLPNNALQSRVLVEYRTISGIYTNYTTVLDTTVKAPRNYITEDDLVNYGKPNGLNVNNNDWQPVYRWSVQFNPPNGTYVPSTPYTAFTQTWTTVVNVVPVIAYPFNETVSLLPLQLEWTATDQTAAFTVQILQGSVSGPTVYSATVRAPYYTDDNGLIHYVFRPQWSSSQYLQLPDGVYYWRVEVNNNGPHLDSAWSPFSRILLDTTGTSSLQAGATTVAQLHQIVGELDYFGRVANRTANEVLVTGNGSTKVYSNLALTNLVSGTSTAEPVVPGSLTVRLYQASPATNLLVFTDVGANTSNLASVTLVVDSTRTQAGWLSSTCTVNYLTGTILSLALQGAPATNTSVLATYEYQGYPYIIQAYRAMNVPGFSGKPIAQVSMNKPGIFTLTGLPADTYTLLGFIDQNGNGRLNNWESWGFVRNLVPSSGPGYAEVRTVTVGTSIITTNTGLHLVVRDRDTDNDKLPDSWEFQNYGSISLHSGDEIINGTPLWQSYYYAQTSSVVSMLMQMKMGVPDPSAYQKVSAFLTGSSSTNTQFVIPTFGSDASGEPVLTWSSPVIPARVNVQYKVFRNPSLIGGSWVQVGEVDGLPGDVAQLRSFVDSDPSRPLGAFYRLQVTVSLQ
jgi:hypothetical protein